MTPRTAEWATLYASGLSLRAVAARAGVTHKTILYAFRDAGIQRRPRCQPHNTPPRVLPQPWPVELCLYCDEERRINPRSGWCHHCTQASKFPSASAGTIHA